MYSAAIRPPTKTIAPAIETTTCGGGLDGHSLVVVEDEVVSEMLDVPDVDDDSLPADVEELETLDAADDLLLAEVEEVVALVAVEVTDVAMRPTTTSPTWPWLPLLSWSPEYMAVT